MKLNEEQLLNLDRDEVHAQQRVNTWTERLQAAKAMIEQAKEKRQDALTQLAAAEGYLLRIQDQRRAHEAAKAQEAEETQEEAINANHS